MTLEVLIVLTLLAVSEQKNVQQISTIAMCGDERILDARGGLDFVASPAYPQRDVRCLWQIVTTRNDSDIGVIFTDLNLGNGVCNQKNYLIIKSAHGSKTFCGREKHIISPMNLRPQKISSTKSSIEISFASEANRSARVGMILIQMDRTNACPSQDRSFPCLDRSGCYGLEDVCNSAFVCRDHSDEINCDQYCNGPKTRCDYSNASSTDCFNVLNERCDGIKQCPEGQDELDCPSETSCGFGKVRCEGKGGGCHMPAQICDGINDCPSGSDEENCLEKLCPNKASDTIGYTSTKKTYQMSRYFLCKNRKCIDEKLVSNGRDDCGDFSDELTTKVNGVVALLVLFIMFLAISYIFLLCSWCLSRRDINRLLNDAPQFPSPPFLGPQGDTSPRRNRQSVCYSETDLVNGSELFEAFARIRRDARRRGNAGARIINVEECQQRAQVADVRHHHLTCGPFALVSLGIDGARNPYLIASRVEACSCVHRRTRVEVSDEEKREFSTTSIIHVKPKQVPEKEDETEQDQNIDQK